MPPRVIVPALAMPSRASSPPRESVALAEMPTYEVAVRVELPTVASVPAATEVAPA